MNVFLSIKYSNCRKPFLFLLVALCLYFLLSAGFLESSEDNTSKHILVNNGAVNCEVVVPDEAGTMAYFAGQELQKLLSQSFGEEVLLTKNPDKDKCSIILGKNKFIEKLNIDFEKIPQDGFIIKSSGNDIFIAGNDGMDVNVERTMRTSAWFKRNSHPQRGTLYGAYEFLERFIGARFYFPGKFGTIVPKHRDFKIGDVDLQISPDQTSRTMGYTGELFGGFDEVYNAGKNSSENEWYYKTLHILRLRTQTKYIPHCHGLREYGHISRFSKSHPEYFALMSNGERYNKTSYNHSPQMCFSSGIREEVYKDAEAYFTGKSAESRGVTPRNRGKYYWSPNSCQPGYFDIMPHDGFFPCNCPECQKHFNGLKYMAMDRIKSSEFMWGFFCEIAEKLKANNIPGTICTMAYPPYRDIPKRSVPDNMDIALCPPGPDARDFDKTLEHIKGWYKKIGNRKVWLWNNYGKYAKLSMPGVPFVLPNVTGSYYKAVAPYTYGAFVGLSQDYYLFKYINAYVAFKIMWDNSTDVDNLLDEHYQLMFGGAADTMEKVYNRFEDIWINKIHGNTVETALGDTAIPPSEYQLWNEVYSAGEIENINRLFEKAEQEAAEEGGFRERVKFMRKNLFGPVVREREKYTSILNKIAGLNFYAYKLAEDEAIAVDGKVSEPAWEKGAAIYLSKFPNEGGNPGRANTIVKVLQDKDNLYISAVCDEPEMNKNMADALERDSFEIFRKSCLEIFINPSDDKKNYYQLAVNSEGSFTDIAGKKLASSQKLDKDWNSNAAVAVKKHADAYIIEIAIPFESLKPYNKDGFPINFNRSRSIEGKSTVLYTWSPYIKRGFHEIENFGSVKLKPVDNKNIISDSDFTGKANSRTVGKWFMVDREKENKKERWKIDRENFISGGCSLLLLADNMAIRQSLPDLKLDTNYILNFFLKTEEIIPKKKLSACGVRVSIWDKKNNYFPTNSFVGTIPWTKQAFTFKTSPEVNKKVCSYIHLSIYEANGKAWFDEVTLREANE